MLYWNSTKRARVSMSRWILFEFLFFSIFDLFYISCNYSIFTHSLSPSSFLFRNFVHIFLLRSPSTQIPLPSSSPITQTEMGETLIHLAVLADNRMAVNYLMEGGHYLNVYNDKVWGAFASIFYVFFCEFRIQRFKLY